MGTYIPSISHRIPRQYSFSSVREVNIPDRRVHVPEQGALVAHFPKLVFPVNIDALPRAQLFLFSIDYAVSPHENTARHDAAQQ